MEQIVLHVQAGIIQILTPDFREHAGRELWAACEQLKQQYDAVQSELGKQKLAPQPNPRNLQGLQQQLQALGQQLARNREQQDAILELPDGAELHVGSCHAQVTALVGQPVAPALGGVALVIEDGVLKEIRTAGVEDGEVGHE